jgi:hypothetical protein
MGKFFNDPASLFTENNVHSRESVGNLSAEYRPSPDSIWNKKWVYCNRTNPDDCAGNISWPAWKADKLNTCINSFSAETKARPNDRLTIGVTVCDLSDSMNELCNVVFEATRKVLKGNCIAGGM